MQVMTVACTAVAQVCNLLGIAEDVLRPALLGFKIMKTRKNFSKQQVGNAGAGWAVTRAHLQTMR